MEVQRNTDGDTPSMPECGMVVRCGGGVADRMRPVLYILCFHAVHSANAVDNGSA